MADQFTSLIPDFAAAAGICLSDAQAALCGRHAELMLRWNLRLNLTRITDAGQIVVKHILDSLLPARFLPHCGQALDVGTGAGFPGVPLRIAGPGLDMTLLDASRKKVSFLSVVAADLRLHGLRAMHGRWEELARQEHFSQKFQLITMRAVRLEPAHLTGLAARMLASGGVFAWWAGPEPEKGESAIAESAFPGLHFEGALSYTLPGIARPRSVWVWKKSD